MIRDSEGIPTEECTSWWHIRTRAWLSCENTGNLVVIECLTCEGLKQTYGWVHSFEAWTGEFRVNGEFVKK